MKLEFLPEGSPDCPLLRLFEFTTDEAECLFRAVTELASGACDRVAVHDLPSVEPVGACRLTLLVRSWDQAVIAKGAPVDFECGFTRGTWDNVAGLIEPFATGAAGF